MQPINLTAAQWLICDNLAAGYLYYTNLPRDIADETYIWCVNNELVKDGELTHLGRISLMMANTK